MQTSTQKKDPITVTIDRHRIAKRVDQLAQRINTLYRGKELTLVGVLTGAFMFLADLVRKLDIPVRMELVSIESYPGTAVRSKGPKVIMPLQGDLTGCDVLIVDDILDSGETMKLLHEHIMSHNPNSIQACVLLRKNRDDIPNRMDAEFVGFDIPDQFVVGYGLDYDEKHRNLPDLCVLDKSNIREG